MFWTNFFIDVLLAAFLAVCALMCLVIMMQRSKQEGLGAAFGGGFTDSVWGAQTSQVLVKTTVWLAAMFFIISICLARLYSHREAIQESSSVQKELLATPVKAATPAPVSVTVPAVPVPNAPTATIPAAAASAPATPPAPAPTANAAAPAPAAPATPPAK
jgi:preprotein translocase subunit SecG